MFRRLTGSRAPATGEPSPGNASIKPLQTRTSLMGLPPTPASRLSRKTPGRTSVSSELREGAGSTQGEPFYRKNMFCTGIKSLDAGYAFQYDVHLDMDGRGLYFE